MQVKLSTSSKQQH
jgi:chromosome segregation ATPase